MPPVREDKPPWSAVPNDLRAAIERMLEARVVRAVRAYGGYAPSATYRLSLSDGRRAFFKGTFPLPPDSAVRWVLVDEERAYRRLGRYMRPWAPEFYGSARAAGWHAIVLEDVRGENVLPWSASRARRAARSYAAFHRRTHGKPLPSWLSRTQHRDFSRFWRSIGRDAQALGRLAKLAAGQNAVARRWLERALPTLIRAERRCLLAREPFVLMHFDTRSDNIRLEGEQLRIFDWPYPSVGPHEFELAAFAQSIVSEGGPAPEQVAAWYSEVLPLREGVLTGSITAIAGYFADRAPRPPMPGLPRIRSVQRRQLKASLAWAARALGLDEPGWLAAVSD